MSKMSTRNLLKAHRNSSWVVHLDTIYSGSYLLRHLLCFKVTVVWYIRKYVLWYIWCIYMWYSPLNDSLKQLWKVCLSVIWNHPLTNLVIRPWVQPTLIINYSNFIVSSVSSFISATAFISRHVCFNWNLFKVIICVKIIGMGVKNDKKNNDPWNFLYFSVNNNIFHSPQKFVWLRYTLFWVGFLGLRVKLPLSV